MVKDRAGLPTVGTLRRYHPSGSVCLVAGWPQHIGGAVALLGRSGDTMVSGRINVLHTVVGRYRSERFAIPCGGPGSGRVAKGWDVSATPNGTMVLDSRRSRCGVKGRCGVYGFQGRPGSGSPEAQCFNGCVRGTGRHCEEAGGNRQGSLRRERATSHHRLYRGCHAFVVLRGRNLVEEKEFKQLMVGDQARGLAVHVLHETCVHQNPRLDSEAGSARCGWHCGYWPHGRLTSPRAVQRLARRCSWSSSGRIVRCACQFQAEPVHGHRNRARDQVGTSVCERLFSVPLLLPTAFAHKVDDQGGVSTFLVLVSRQTLLCCTWACLCLKRSLCVWLASPVVVSFMATPLGWGERLSTPQVQRLLLHVPWLHRTKRDCTRALFLTSSVCTSTLSPCFSEEERLAPLPFFLTMSRSFPEEEGQALLLTMSVSSSEVRS